MANTAMPLDASTSYSGATYSAATRSTAAQPAPLSPIIRSPTEEPYNAKGEMSFSDFLDIINPLQHIPIVSSIYRAVSGDTIKPASQVIGGILYGGVVGGATSIASAIIAQANGGSIEDKVMTAMGGASEKPGAEPGAEKPDVITVAQAEAAHTASQPQPASQAAPQAAAAAPAALAASQAPATPAQRLVDSLTPHPSKMPARDTMVASSVQAKQTMKMAMHERQAERAAGVAPPAASSPAPEAAPALTPASAGVETPEAFPNTMMRNLAKYEAAKKSLNQTPPNIRIAG